MLTPEILQDPVKSALFDAVTTANTVLHDLHGDADPIMLLDAAVARLQEARALLSVGATAAG